MRLRRLTVWLLWLVVLSAAGIGVAFLLGANLQHPLTNKSQRGADGLLIVSGLAMCVGAVGLLLAAPVEIWDRLDRRLRSRAGNVFARRYLTVFTLRRVATPRYELRKIKPQPMGDVGPPQRAVREALERAQREGVERAKRAKAVTKRKPE